MRLIKPRTCPLDGEKCLGWLRPFSVSWNRTLLLCAAGAALLFIVMISGLVGQIPEHTRGQASFSTQEAHDDNQDLRIATLEKIAGPLVDEIQNVRINQAYELGGIAGFGALLTILKVMQLRK